MSTATAIPPIEDGGRPSGLPGLDRIPWGSHLCHFYGTAEDLLEAVVPYFRAGLEAGERCLWVTSDPAGSGQSHAALAAAVPDLDARIRNGQIEIVSHEAWYVNAQGLTPEEVIAAWVDREAEALRQGYAGLRISGNTAWLERRDWGAFEQYEADVHHCFHGRRVLALCSYHLARCDADQMLDVLQNHELALVRRGGGWRIVRSATQMLAAARALEEEQEPPGHLVRFYDEGFPAKEIAEFLAEGLMRGEAGVILATGDHDRAIGEDLEAQGVDVQALLNEARLIRLDAAEMLDRLERDPAMLRSQVRGIFQRLTCFPGIRAFGELVDLLCREGRVATAVAFEGVWDELVQEYRAPLFCAYSARALEGVDVDGVEAICTAHSHVREASGPEPAPVREARLRISLRQSQEALASEIHRRQALEIERIQLSRAERRALGRAEALADQLDRLQRVTAAFSEAQTPADLGDAVVAEMAEAVGASRALLALCSEDDGSQQVVAQVGLGSEVREGAHLALAGAEPALEAMRERRPLWLSEREAIRTRLPELDPAPASLAWLPLVLGRRSLGTIAVAFEEPQDFTSEQRALLLDISRQAALALDRAYLYQEALRANRAKDEFLARLGHELRNPLAPISTALHLLKLRHADSAELAILDRQTTHLTRLVDDLLDVSRIACGRVTLQRATVELAEVVGRALEITTPLLEARAHHVFVDVPTAGMPVDADPHRLSQAFSNLLANAAKYTPPGGHVGIRARRVENRLEIRVTDDGMGIEPELLPRIFESFVQDEQALDRSRGGLGLGLAIVRALVELHGGTVSVRSDGPGHGSEFCVHLPSAPACANGADVAGDRTQGAAPDPVEGRRVLVVDDNRDAADMIVLALSAAGYEVRAAYDAPAALELVHRFQPEVALLDIGLPVMDGHALARQLLRELGPAAPKLVALTGYGLPSDRRTSSDAGFMAHLVKPIGLDELEALLAGMLEPDDRNRAKLPESRSVPSEQTPEH